MYKEQLNENNRKVWRDYGDWVDTNSLEEKRKFRKERDRWDGGLNIHPFSIHIVLTSAWVVKRRIAQYLWTFSFFFLERQFGGHCCFYFFRTAQHPSRKQTVVFMFANVLKKKAICCTNRVIFIFVEVVGALSARMEENDCQASGDGERRREGMGEGIWGI